jgi:DHA2 family multidrug resistance protein-like MFS transporter
MVATARLIGQSTGAALVAFCLTVFHLHGTWLAILLAAVFAAAASIASFSRLVVAAPAR